MTGTQVKDIEPLFLRWLRLSGSQKVTVFRVVLVALVVEVALRVAPVSKVAGWMGTPLRLDDKIEGDGVTGPARMDPEKLDRARFAMRVMEHWPFAEGTCLRQSLVVGHFLRGYEPRLLLGVKRDGGEVRAHAWIEVGQTSLGLDNSFVPFRRLS